MGHSCVNKSITMSPNVVASSTDMFRYEPITVYLWSCLVYNWIIFNTSNGSDALKMHKNTQPAAPLPLLGERISTSVSPNSTIQNTRKRAVFVTDAYFTLFSHQIHQNQCPRSISDSPRASIPHKSLYKASPKLPSSSSHLIITVYSCIMALPSSTPASISAHHIAENLHRRISQLTIDQHVTLLSLHAKMNQALERGLPRVLALSPVEMETYSHLLVLATAEQNEVIETLKNLSRKLASYDPECHTQRYANAWVRPSNVPFHSCDFKPHFIWAVRTLEPATWYTT